MNFCREINYWKWVKRIVLTFVIIIALAAIGIYAASEIYAGTIGPGIKIGPFKVAGLDQETARNLLYSKTDALLDQGLDVIYKNEIAHISLSSFGTDDPDVAKAYIDFDIDAAIEHAYQTYHHDNPALDAFLLAFAFLARPDLTIPTTISYQAIYDELINEFPELAEPPINASYTILQTKETWEITVTDDAPGTVVNLDDFTNQFESMLLAFDLNPIILKHEYTDAQTQVSDAINFVSAAHKILENAPYQLIYQDDQSWELTALAIANALEPQMNENEIHLGLNQQDMQVHLEAIAQEVEVEVQDAHFAMDNGRVTEFVASHDGVAFEQDETLEAITKMWLADEQQTEIIVSIVEPRVNTEQVNDLGISEMLGQGTSNFRGSPYNRIMNIKHGASKLNGILIAPGEEFSLLDALKPFTVADGYLRELVIRGNEIIPEVGGGLCQIGTTTFRTTMNSGLSVTQRSNHSLVVSYYNDPSNGNPGTDATIYDPAPDFRFVNDTDNYILFTTNVDTETSILSFSFWGTSDGRNGYYSAPVVTSWIPYGETEYVDTEDLEPGEEDCQGAHIGANANFTYYIERPDGTVEDTYYESHYRPLPEMCLIGIDPDAEEEAEEEAEELKKSLDDQ